MSIIYCPKCKSPNDDKLHDGSWLVCTICNNRWFPSAATIDSLPTSEIPQQRAAPPRAATSFATPLTPSAGIPAGRPGTTIVGTSLPQLPTAAIGFTPLPVPPSAQPPGAQPVPPPVPPRAAFGTPAVPRDASGEYMPDEPGTDSLAKRALTERVDGARASGLVPALGSPLLAAAKEAANRPAAPGSRQGPAVAHDPETGPTIDSDLFDRLENEARYKRSEMKTVPEIVFDDPAKYRTSVPHSDHSAKVTCPVCGHGFASAGPQHTCPQCGTAYNEDSNDLSNGDPSDKDELIGRTLRGCLIDRKLGEGGMGAVYHAKQLSLDRSVAVKVLPADLARNKNFIQRFEREAKSLARINHPNILQIYDFGDDPQLSLYFMIIEYVEGLDLGEVLNRRGLLGQIEVLDLLRQSVQGLEAAAEKGVIHRDIKPDNLMISGNGLVKVSDFGLAKGYVAQVGVTAAGVRVGTPAFMSPEQCDGVEVDYRSDVYNLGATAFLCLTGRLPFDGETPFAIMLKHKTEAVPSMCDIDPTIDRRVDALIKRLLSKRPAERCGSLRELIEDIENLETELAGTDSVLRKSKGPFRALINGGAPREISPRARLLIAEPVPVVNKVEIVDLPPSPIERQTPADRADRLSGNDLRGRERGSSGPLGDRMAQAGRPASGPLGGGNAASGRPSSGPLGQHGQGGPGDASARRSGTGNFRRTRGPMPAMAPPSSPVPTTPPVADGRQSGTDLPAVDGGDTPLPAGDKPNRSSRRLDVELQQARERGRRSQLDLTIANGDRLAEGGQIAEAAAEWTAAADLADGDPGLQKELRRRAAAARRRSGAMRLARRAVIAVVSVVLLVLLVFFCTPATHNWLAKKRLDVLLSGLSSVPQPAQQVVALKDFAQSNRDPWSWYVSAFKRSYTVAASAEAEAEAQRIENLPTATAPPDSGLSARATAEIAQVTAQAQNPAVPWETVARQCSELLTRVRAQGRELAEYAAVGDLGKQAEGELAAQRSGLERIAQARSAGDHAQALALAAAWRTRHTRATAALLLQLPLPARIRVEVPSLTLPADLALQVDGAAVALAPANSSANGWPAAEAVACRAADRETPIDLRADGFIAVRQALAGGTGNAERLVPLFLRQAPAWAVGYAAAGVAWARPRATAAGLLVQQPQGLLVLRPADGAVAARLDRATPVSPLFCPLWLPLAGNRLLLAQDDGTVQVLGSLTLIPEQTAHRGKAEVVAWLDLDLTLQNAKRIHAAIERNSAGSVLVAQDGAREYWRYAALRTVAQPPQLFGHDDRLYVFDDQALHLLEEDGTVVRVFALPAARLGQIVELPAPPGRRDLLIPTVKGVQRLQLGGHQDPVRALGDPALAQLGAGLVVTDLDDALVAGDRSIALLRFTPAATVAWRQDQPRPLGVPPVLSGQFVVTADDQGTLLVRDRASGVVLQRVVHGVPLAGPPLVVELTTGPGVLVTDRNGQAAAYPIRR